MSININDGITWNWLIECGIEAHMFAIKAISMEADSEFLIESSLSEMVEELQTMRLKINEEKWCSMFRLSFLCFYNAWKASTKITRNLYSSFFYPFLERIRNYNVLALNLRQISMISQHYLMISIFPFSATVYNAEFR